MLETDLNFIQSPNSPRLQFSSFRKPSLKAVYDALCDLGSADGVDPDWRTEILDQADPEDIKKIKDAFARGRTEAEVAYELDIWPR